MVIKRSWDCLKCKHADRESEPRAYYRNPRDIPCLKEELENNDLEVCPHFELYFSPRRCQLCGSKNIKHLPDKGEKVCLDCGHVIEERTLTTHRGVSKGRSR